MNQSDLLIDMGFGRGTNPVCDRYEDSQDHTGCLHCGHQQHEHHDLDPLVSTAAGRETTAHSSGHVLADGQWRCRCGLTLPDAAAWRAHSDAGREHDIRCRCGPCNPEECGVKHPTRSYYCMEDKGHDGPHVDHEDRFVWSRTLGAPDA